VAGLVTVREATGVAELAGAGLLELVARHCV
jgi:hypothetical protein